MNVDIVGGDSAGVSDGCRSVPRNSHLITSFKSGGDRRDTRSYCEGNAHRRGSDVTTSTAGGDSEALSTGTVDVNRGSVSAGDGTGVNPVASVCIAIVAVVGVLDLVRLSSDNSTGVESRVDSVPRDLDVSSDSSGLLGSGDTSRGGREYGRVRVGEFRAECVAASSDGSSNGGA